MAPNKLRTTLLVVALILQGVIIAVVMMSRAKPEAAPQVAQPHPMTRPQTEEIVGIGIALQKDQATQEFRIMNVLPGSPALRAGLKSGMLVEKIDDQELTGRNLPECVNLIRGPAGSKVRLELVDLVQDKTNTVELTREKIQVHM
jgi:C-terminal processing protease CtpA/Prc